MDIDDFFAGHDEPRRLFDALREAIDRIGPAESRVTKSQVDFRRHRPFAWAWMPGQYLRGKIAPLVLSLALRRRDPSPRWKQIVEPKPGWFMHHLELYAAANIDGEVEEWLREAWEAAE